jgi:ABC-type branched-subunit amino acid transport system ATPase component
MMVAGIHFGLWCLRSSELLLVEHNMRLVMGFSERVHVLDFGRTIRVGTPAEVSRDADVIDAYLGSAV